MSAAHEWLPISTAPDLERIWVAGVQPRSGGCIAYWWWHEDAADNGVAIESPNATHWARIILPAKFPYPAASTVSPPAVAPLPSAVEARGGEGSAPHALPGVV